MPDQQIPQYDLLGALAATDLFLVNGPNLNDTTYRAPTSVVETYFDALYTAKAGDTMTGLLQWSGTAHAGVQINSLTTVQRDALTPGSGMLIYNTTDGQFQGYDGAWGQIGGVSLPVAIADGGTGQSTAQAAIDTLSAVAGATDEHVLTKDTASGNAIFKASAGGSALPVVDTTSIVKGSADDTKLIRFEVDGLTTGTTRVLTPPDADFTLVGLEVAQTFTAAQTIDTNSVTALLVEQNGVNDDVLVVDTINGKVGIGTGSPGNILHVLGDLTSNIAQFVGSSSQTGDGAFAHFALINTDQTNGNSGKFQWFDSIAPGDQFAFAEIRGVYDTHSTHLGELRLRTRGTDGLGNRIVIKKTGLVGINEDSPSAQLHVVSEDAATAVITDVSILVHNSTDTPAANFGTGLLFQGKSATTPGQNTGRLAYLWATATHPTRKARGILSVYDANGEREGIRIEASGSAPMLGVLGANAIARQAHIIDADGTLADITTKFNSLLAYLENFGFIATS